MRTQLIWVSFVSPGDFPLFTWLAAQEFDVRVDTSAEKEKTHSIGRFTTGLPPFSKERSTENRWTLRKDVPQGRQLTGNMRVLAFDRG
jgi:transcription initiation factor TFIIF subunit alpha